MSYDVLTNSFTGVAAKSMRCWCSMEFVIPASLYEYFVRMDGKFSLHCPLGHQFVPGGKSEADKVRDELAREKHRTEQARAAAEHSEREREAAERRAAAARGQVTKLRNRVKHGVCPACKRSFGDLARHMKCKHPAFGEQSDG